MEDNFDEILANELDISPNVGFECVNIQQGVVHIKDFLTTEQQLKLWDDIQASTWTHKETKARNANSNFLKIISFGRRKHGNQIPNSFINLSSSACSKASQTDNLIPANYKIDYITSFKYPQTDGKLTNHCDKIEGWVVLFSFGCTCEFFVKGPQMRARETIQFKSGDSLIFNGGTEYDIQHGISTIIAGTAPDYLPEELQDWRVSIQFRQTLKNDNPPLPWEGKKKGRKY